MKIDTAETTIAPSIIDDEYLVRTDGRDYRVKRIALASTLFREWRSTGWIFDRGMMGEQILRRK